MVIVFDGKKPALAKKRKLIKAVKLSKKKLNLTAVLIGENPASKLYLRLKYRLALDLGVGFDIVSFPATAGIAEISKKIELLNKDKNVSGLMVQLPMLDQGIWSRLMLIIASRKLLEIKTMQPETVIR